MIFLTEIEILNLLADGKPVVNHATVMTIFLSQGFNELPMFHNQSQ